MALKVGENAPQFALPGTEGSFHLHEALKLGPVILYFYPKDFTAGCTAEACEFRDHWAAFKEVQVRVVGISKDSVETHHRFKKAHNLPFELVSDADGKVCKAYDALVPVLGIPKRITYLIGQNGKILAAYSDFFGASGHVQSMLAEKQKLKS